MAAPGSWQFAVHMQETEIQEIRADIARLRSRELMCEANLCFLREQAGELADLPRSTAEAAEGRPERPLKEPRRRAARKGRERLAPKDGLTLAEREEQALRRHGSLRDQPLSRLLYLYAASGCRQTRLDLRVLAARLFVAEATANNGGTKVLRFQEEVRRLSADLGLDPKDHADLNAAFTKAATERVRGRAHDS
jgi:hypothetical protein